MPLNFKEEVEKDVDKIFFNMLEFAETHTIQNGKTIQIVVNSDTEQDLLRPGRVGNRQPDGIYTKQTVIFAKVSDFEDKPVQGNQFILDGKKHTIAKLDENMGIYEIHLQAQK